MGYHIDRKYLNQLYIKFNETIFPWSSSLVNIQKSMKKLCDNEDFNGAGADAIKNYITLYHINTIQMILEIVKIINYALVEYIYGLGNYDSDIYAILDEDFLSETIDTVGGLLTRVQDEHSEGEKWIDMVSDLVPDAGLQGLETYTDPLEIRKKKLENLRHDVGEYDATYLDVNTGNTNIRETAKNVKKIVSSMNEKGVLTFQEIKQNNFFTDNFKRMIEEDSINSEAYIQQNAEKYKKDLGAINENCKVYIKDLKKKKIETGCEIAAGSLIAIVTVVTLGAGASVGTGTILGAESVVSSTLCSVFVVNSCSDLCEGVNDICLGCSGRVYETGFNPVRDVIFEGDQEAYDLEKSICNSSMILSGSVMAISTAGAFAASTGGDVVMAENKMALTQLVNVSGQQVINYGADELGKSCDNEIVGFLMAETTSIGAGNEFARAVNNGFNGTSESFKIENDDIISENNEIGIENHSISPPKGDIENINSILECGNPNDSLINGKINTESSNQDILEFLESPTYTSDDIAEARQPYNPAEINAETEKIIKPPSEAVEDLNIQGGMQEKSQAEISKSQPELENIKQGNVDITENIDTTENVKKVEDRENEIGNEGGLDSKRVEYYLNKSRNNLDSDTVILGSTGKYDVIAENEGYTYFKMSDDVWETLENEAGKNYDKIWKVNQQFIDEQIASNKNILLSNDPYKGYYFPDGTSRFYQREIDYISSKGYIFKETTDGLWNAIRK